MVVIQMKVATRGFLKETDVSKEKHHPYFLGQEWVEQPQNQTVAEGRDAVLACRVRNKVPP